MVRKPNNTNNNGIILKKSVKLFPQPKKIVANLIFDKNGILGIYIRLYSVIVRLFFFAYTHTNTPLQQQRHEDLSNSSTKFQFFGL